METKELRTFTENTIAYFQKITGQEARAGVPRILKEEEEEILLSITGAIGIAGEIQGAIYLTGEEPLFRDLLARFNPEAAATRENILDAAGELANTIAGNAQTVFGSGFRISVPMIITGKEQRIRMKEPRFLIPIEWESHKFFLVIGLTRDNG